MSTRIPFKVSARTARLIGRENVATSKGAIIELVKNGYDADSRLRGKGDRGQAPVPVLKISKLHKNTLISTEKEASCIIKYRFAMAVLRGRDSYS